jgi:small ligand-binding sensory domain FIST
MRALQRPISRSMQGTLTRSIQIASANKSSLVEEESGHGRLKVLPDFNALAALRSCCEDIKEQLGSQEPDLVVFFTSLVDNDTLQKTPAALQDAFPNATILGSAAEGGIFASAGGEVQGAPAVSVLAASLPDVEVASFHTDVVALPEINGHSWGDLTSLPEESTPHLLMLGSGHFNCAPVLGYLDLALPFATKIGGIVPGRIFYAGGEWRVDGVGGVMLKGNVCVDAIVSQGCAPLGKGLLITGRDGNSVTSLNGIGVMAALQQDSGLTDTDFASNLLAGLAVDPKGSVQRAGGSMHRTSSIAIATPENYAMRHVLGIDTELDCE